MGAVKTTRDGRAWLVLVYRVTSGSSSRRTYVWRQLRQLGAIYLQQAVAIMPDRPDLRAGLDQLGQRIRSGGGEASLLATTSPDAAWEADLVERFNSARNAEYDEVIESVERFEDEIRRESRKKRFRFAELEESEADWEKLRRWFARLLERDFFGASGRASAEAALARGHDLLNGFTREVYRLEGLDSEGTGDGRTRRSSGVAVGRVAEGCFRPPSAGPGAGAQSVWRRGVRGSPPGTSVRVAWSIVRTKSAPNAAAGLNAPWSDRARVSSTARMLADAVNA